MKISEQWLREWVNPAIDGSELGEKLTFAGIELDGVEPAASEFTNVVIGRIISVEMHPDADRLRVCQVDVAAEEPIQIVTNVADVAAEQRVPVALVGANLPDSEGKPFKIKKGKLRGVVSQGMFCGGDTLGMPDGNEGLLALPNDAPVGGDLRDFLQANDTLYDFDITPNRADCNSVSGIAREVGVLTQTEVNHRTIDVVPASHETVLPVTLVADQACKRYAGRLIKGVNAQATTPLWMREKLRRSGLRSLSFLVDVTNYILLEIGQPMHAFDADTLSGGIQARFAKAEESLTLLDGQTITLDTESLVIADDDKAIALAGIMGGLDTSVTDKTTNVFLEAAFFTPTTIAGKARSYGLHTDSSYRFERGVSPDLQVLAIERATKLILDVAGGEAGPVIDKQHDAELQTPKTITLRRERIERLLGIVIADQDIERILMALGCQLEANEAGWQVTAPLFRFDFAIEADLIEELARVHGYDKIPSRLRKLKPVMALPNEANISLDSLQHCLVERGYQETVSYSFGAKKIEQALSGNDDVIELVNPISADLSVMRSTLWSGLVPTALHNIKRQQSRLRLFESGLTFVKSEQGLVQRKKIAGLLYGTLHTVNWSEKSRAVDFFDLKGDVESLLAHHAEQVEFRAFSHPALHPGQSAEVLLAGEVIGCLGMLHPELEKTLDFSRSVFLFELDVDALSQGKLPSYDKVSVYPTVQRDIALMMPKEVSYQAVTQVIDSLALAELKSYQLFDNYEGGDIEQNRKSLALNLIFQDISRTLEDGEIASFFDTIADQLHNQLGAVLRD